VNENEVFDAVEAALLNSSGDPNDEVFDALEAVAGFSFLEVDMTETQFMDMAREAWKVVQES
jgi:hypothetical protein